MIKLQKKDVASLEKSLVKHGALSIMSHFNSDGFINSLGRPVVSCELSSIKLNMCGDSLIINNDHIANSDVINISHLHNGVCIRPIDIIYSDTVYSDNSILITADNENDWLVSVFITGETSKIKKRGFVILYKNG